MKNFQSYKNIYKNISKIIYLLLSSLILLQTQHCCSVSTNYSNTYQHMLDKISEKNIFNTIKNLQAFKTRYTLEKQTQTAEYLYNYLKKYDSLNVSYDCYEANNKLWKNVIAIRKGEQNYNKVYIACAHYDSISSKPFTFAPGADDNATGVAILLEAASILAKTQCKNTVKFVFFSNEEQGHKGSKHYVEKLKTKRENIKGVINVDTVGFVNPNLFTLPPDLKKKGIPHKVFYLAKQIIKRPLFYFQLGFKNPNQILLVAGRPSNRFLVEKIYSIIKPLEIGIKKNVGSQCG